ncbi:glycerol-3-phosphate dehydrogenase [Candidatus Palauibacter sp.]|uniref:glycerol-3-phosphate dehydrogenase n=1 Tax=Candidatus Palauibacter sp. TaxID=3101350 RepID=UPI003B597916
MSTSKPAESSGSSSSSRDAAPVTVVRGRDEHLRALRETAFDVLVIGGGISGAAVARDAARRGFRTALVEALDFAWGTSSRSSRLVHGGLRYLEHFELDLVFEASQERRTLLRIATHLVRPLEFLFPIFRDGRIGKRKLDAGMWLYDALSLFRNIERHQMLDTRAMLAREPRLRAEGLLGGARYFDAQVDDAKLVVTTILAAVETGADVANRAEVTNIDASDWPGHRVTVRDVESGRELEVDALAIVNATGVWAEHVLGRIGTGPPTTGRAPAPTSGVQIKPSRGTHIHVARERIGHAGALIFEAPQDGRVMFVLPWREDLTIIGTTDEYFDGEPRDVAATPEEIAYLLEATNRLLPASKLGPEDVISAWAGLRPLVAPTAAGDEGAVSRDFEVHEHPHGIFTLSGGKLTSHRRMAEETVDRVQAFLAPAGVPAARKVDTDKVPLPGARFRDLGTLRDGIRARAGTHGLGTDTADRLTRAYGTRAERVLDLVQRDRRLGEKILPERPHVLAEAVYSVRNEMAMHVEDVLFRRTRIGLETRNGTSRAARRVATVMATEMGWTSEQEAEEVKRATAFRAADDTAIRDLASRLPGDP